MKTIKGKESKMNNGEKTTSIGKWSVALAIIPIGGVLLFLLPILLGDHSGEAGLGAIFAIGIILDFGAHITVGTGLLGAALGVFAIRKTQWRQGAAGLILNISVLILAGTLLTTLYHSLRINPDRLPIAAAQGKKKTVEKLLDRGFDVNRQCGDSTALSNAAAGGYEEIVELLLSHGADVSIGHPVSGAAKNGYEKIVRLLLDHGADPNCLKSAIHGNHVEIVQILLDYGADINQKVGNSGRTPLQAAVESGAEEIVKLLINKGANVNAKNDQGETPLHVLVRKWPQSQWPNCFRERVIILLLDAGSDIEAKTKREGKTPLWLAAEAAKSRDSVKVLLNHGANLANIKDLHVRFAAVSTSLSKMELTKWVQANASDINARSSRGESLLHAAVKGKNKNLIEILLTMGVDVNTKSNTGDTALHWAMTEPIPEIVDYLVNHGANINAQNNKGITPLHVLSRPVSIGDEKPLDESKRKTFEILLKNGAKVDIVNDDGKTPLGQLMSWLPAKKEGREYKNELLQLMQNYEKNSNPRAKY
jgi:ankyrin repeat protein